MTTDAYLAIAAAIGARLCRDAVWHEERCTWLGATLEWFGADMVVYRSFGGELYDGSCGIACFLGHLWEVTGDDNLRQTAVGAVRHALSFAERSGTTAGLGLYDGLTGIALNAVRLGDQLACDDSVARGIALAERIAETTGAPITVDVLSGAAGVALGLTILGSERERADLVGCAAETADAVLAQARQCPAGWFWALEPAVTDNLHNPCSYAHGNAGIAHAFDELHAVTAEPRFREASLEAVRWERSWFDRRTSSWADLRTMTPSDLDAGRRPPSCEHWCHGAVGLAFHRLRRFSLTGEPSMQAEAAAAIMGARAMADRVMRVGPPYEFEANFSLCHGLGGVLDLLVYGFEVLGNMDLLLEASRFADFGRTAALANNDRWICGLDGAGETPGLMLGLAGIGMAYLRLAVPGRLPPAAILINRGARLSPPIT